jgi:hypothetical protein
MRASQYHKIVGFNLHDLRVALAIGVSLMGGGDGGGDADRNVLNIRGINICYDNDCVSMLICIT